MEMHATSIPQPPRGLEHIYASHLPLEALRGQAHERLCGHGFDAGHDLAHADRVGLWTLRLLESEVLANEKSAPGVEAVAASLLHDVVNLPKDHPERRLASARSAAVARHLLPSHGFDSIATERIANAIEDHSYSRGATPQSALGRALQDADRLETLGAIGIMRVFSTGARLGADYFDPSDPWSQSREPDDLRYSIDHFRTKLLRLAGSMCTDAGRREAERRTQRMRRFLEDLADELDTHSPRWLREITQCSYEGLRGRVEVPSH